MAGGGFIGVNVSGQQAIAEKLRKLEPAVADAGVELANEYMINVFKLYPPYSYVSWNDIGGFISVKQRRFVMASIKDGTINIPYNRTQTLAAGWHTVGSGQNQIVVNEVDYAPYVMGDSEQSRMMMYRNWDILSWIIADRMDEIIRKFEAGAKNAIHDLGMDG